MIYIDDAGSGSLIGGTGIGLYHMGTKQYEFKIIPVKYFQNMKYYQQKLYQQETKKIICQVLTDWQVDYKKDEIYLCSSYVFDKVRVWLSENNISYQSSQIGAPLQNLVQRSFFDYLISLGLPQKFLKHTRYAYGFHRLLHWVYADKKKREKLCKTCWKSFQSWGYLTYTSDSITVNEQRLCLKCGEDIHPGTKGKLLTFTSKHSEQLIIHKSCSSSTA